MKISKQYLKQIIKEELEKISEDYTAPIDEDTGSYLASLNWRKSWEEQYKKERAEAKRLAGMKTPVQLAKAGASAADVAEAVKNQPKLTWDEKCKSCGGSGSYENPMKPQAELAAQILSGKNIDICRLCAGSGMVNVHAAR